MGGRVVAGACEPGPAVASGFRPPWIDAPAACRQWAAVPWTDVGEWRLQQAGPGLGEARALCAVPELDAPAG